MRQSTRLISIVVPAIAVMATAMGMASTVHAEEASADANAEVHFDSEGKRAAKSSRGTDHGKFVGSFAVGYLGQRWVPIATSPSFQDGHIISMSAKPGTVDAPVIGMRYWLSDGMGLDLGIGFRTQGGSTTWTRRERIPGNPAAEPAKYEFTADDISQTAVLIHGGLPLALDTHKHFVFELIPEINLGFSTGTLKDQQDQPPSMSTAPVTMRDIKLSGLRLDVGGRIGSEIHFGFIGLPNLALQATVGMYFSLQKIKADGGGHAARTPGDPSTQAPKATYEHTSTSFSTTSFDSPWAIFQNTISALYYF